MEQKSRAKNRGNMPLPFTPAPPISMGLRAGRPPGWPPGGPDPLGIPGLYTRQMTEKNRLLDTWRQAVFALHKTAEAAAIEGAMLIQDIAAVPGAADKQKDRPPHIQSGKAGNRFLSACRLIPEDVLLVIPQTGTSQNQTEWRLQGGLLAFPGHWQLADKMGKTLAELHSPVPEFSQRLAVPVNRFFNSMQAGRISWRQNWSLQTDDRLYAPHREAVTPEKSAPVPALAGQSIFVRIETQHFYKLPASGAVMFFIRTSLAPLDFWQDNISPIAGLAARLRQLSPAMADYKAVGGLLSALEGWLQKQMDR